MADKEINALTDGGAVVAGDLAHVVRSGNSRKVALKAQLPATPASSSGPASMEFAEDTDNGSNKVTVIAPAALASDVTVTLPSSAGTLALTSQLPGDQDKANAAQVAFYQAKSQSGFTGYRRGKNTFWDGFADSSGINASRTSGHALDASAKALKPSKAVGSAISGSLGTAFGNMTSNGGLAAAFDGNTNQGTAASAAGVSVTSAYVGRSHSSAVGQVVVHGSNDGSYDAGGGLQTITLELYGKTGSAPANATDGTLLGSISFTELSNESAGRTIPSNNMLTVFDHRWVRVTTSGATSNLFIAEAVFYGVGATSNMTYSTTLQTADAAVTSVTATFELDEIDAITLPTNLTAIATCNGWTNNGAMTITKIGAGQSGRNLYKAVATGLTSGTSFAAELVFAGNKYVPVYGMEVRAE